MAQESPKGSQTLSSNNPKDVGQNPMYDALDVNLRIPETIDITMVEAKSLGDFELWSFLVSLMSNFVVGFVVAWATAPTVKDDNSSFKTIYGSVALCFIALFVLFGAILAYKVWQMHRSKKIIKTKLSVDTSQNT